MPPEICIFQRPGQYTEGEAEGHGLSRRLGGATLLFYPLSPRYISRRKLEAPGRGLILQRHQLLSTTGARDHMPGILISPQQLLKNTDFMKSRPTEGALFLVLPYKY